MRVSAPTGYDVRGRRGGDGDVQMRGVWRGARGPPLAYGLGAPDYWVAIPEAARAARATLDDERCTIDAQRFFVKGNIVIPLRDTAGEFIYTVWVSLSEQNFRRMSVLRTVAGREREPACFGWLSNRLPGYPDTLRIKTMVHTRPVGERPTIELEPTDHPLAVEQQTGITMQRVPAIAAQMRHR